MLGAAFRYITDVFIVFLLFWMTFWDSHPINPIKKFWIPKLQPFFVWLGLHANWAMFSPDPPSRTIWPKVKMTMKNGDVVDWEPAPIETMRLIDKIRLKKFHKFYHEVARPGLEYQTKRDFVEYLLRRQFHTEPCIKVEIYLIFRPGLPFHDQASEQPQPSKQLVYTFHPTQQADS
jgi:hypothetical protein